MSERVPDGRSDAAAAHPEAAPPFLGSWRNVYLLVLGELGVLVVLFYGLRRWAE